VCTEKSREPKKPGGEVYENQEEKMDGSLEQRWKTLREEGRGGKQEWRVAHPQATFREREEAVHERVRNWKLGCCRTSSAPRLWNGSGGPWKTETAAPGVVGQDRRLSRRSGICPAWKTGLFPLDEEVAFLPGELSPHAQENLARVSIWMLCA
jgi:hypothetical protein